MRDQTECRQHQETNTDPPPLDRIIRQRGRLPSGIMASHECHLGLLTVKHDECYRMVSCAGDTYHGVSTLDPTAFPLQFAQHPSRGHQMVVEDGARHLQQFFDHRVPQGVPH